MKASKPKRPMARTCWAICDGDLMLEIYPCDSPDYAKRKYMGFKIADGNRQAMLDKWEEHYAAHRQVVQFQCTPL